MWLQDRQIIWNSADDICNIITLLNVLTSSSRVSSSSSSNWAWLHLNCMRFRTSLNRRPKASLYLPSWHMNTLHNSNFTLNNEWQNRKSLNQLFSLSVSVNISWATHLFRTLSLSGSLLLIFVVRKSKNTLQMSKQAK